MCLTFNKVEGTFMERTLEIKALFAHLHEGGLLLSLALLAPKELGTGLSQTAQGFAALLFLHQPLTLPDQPMPADSTKRAQLTSFHSILDP